MAEPSPENYHVGWICALGTELTASRLFLDSIYETKLPLAHNDSNTYVRGRMGEHNVVITVLPVGATGTNAAATATNNMVRSYRNLKVVLMVGIGGGAPTAKNDIRLGDVVISAKSGQYGAVVQYDLGRQHQGRGFEPTSFLSLPPTSISTVANVVKSNHELDETNSLTSKIDAVLSTRSKLRRTYGKPEEATDVLFKSEYLHAGHDTCDDCDTTQVVQRRVREDDEQGPQVYYGLIASANLVMRDAKFRDTLAKEKGVLCFEMEAAGMMNNCPCLVIRGICDYSDSHKNKHWQGYAAMAAAAYGKELLLQLEPQEMAKDQTIAQALTDVSNEVKDVGKSVTRVHQRMDRRRLETWLSTISGHDYAASKDRYLRGHADGTSDWFFKSSEFQKWVERPGSVFYCPGIPGAGKSVIVSVISNHLGKIRESAVAYIYYKSDEKDQNQGNVLASLLEQLVRVLGMSQHAEALLQSYQIRKERPPDKDLIECLRLIISGFTSPVYILVDSIDESPREPGGFFDEAAFEYILGLCRTTSARILVTSRPNETVEAFIRDRANDGNFFSLTVSPTAHELRTYLRLRLVSFSNSGDRVKQNVEERKVKCIEKIIKVCLGMFLLATHFGDVFAKLKTLEEVKRIEDKLDEMVNMPGGPDRLTQAYNLSMTRIHELGDGDKQRALRLLRWIVHAPRRMTGLELQHAVAVQLESSDFSEDTLPSITDLLSTCAGLIRKNVRHTDKIELIHSTALDFLRHRQEINTLETKSELVATCVTYLSFESFSTGPCRSIGKFDDRKKQYPFYVYASSYWGQHTSDWVDSYRKKVESPRHSKSEGDFQCLTRRLVLFLRKTAHLLASLQGYTSRFPGHEASNSPKKTSPLHLAARYGLDNVVEMLLQDSSHLDVNELDGYGNTPLMNAARHGHVQVARLLLQHPDIDPNKRDDRDRRTAFLIAAGSRIAKSEKPGDKDGNPIVSEMLRYPAVRTNVKDRKGRTPLSHAAGNGLRETVRILLALSSARFDAAEPYHLTPLARAAMRGHKDIVADFLSKLQADRTEAPGKQPRKFLNVGFLMAADAGRTEVLEVMFRKADTEIDVDYKNNQGRTALWLATKNGHLDTIEFLVNTWKADVSIADKDGISPAVLPFKDGRDELAKTFLGLGKVQLQVSHQDLWLAMSKVIDDSKFEADFVSAIQVLGFDASVGHINGKGRTPLHWAASRGLADLIRYFLCRQGVDTTQLDDDGQAPIHVAAASGSTAAVQLLAEYQPSHINLKSQRGQTPLMVAAEHEHVGVVKFLLDSQAGVNYRERERGNTAVMIAVQKANAAVLRLLLQTVHEPISEPEERLNRHVIVNFRDDKLRTPLIWAVASGNLEIVRILAQWPRILPCAQDKHGTALQLAVIRNRLDIVSVLAPLSKPAFCRQDRKGRTPLFVAVQRGNVEVVKELLKVPPHWIEINRKSKDGVCLLSEAVRQRFWPAVTVLSRVQGLDFTTRDRDGRTALSGAIVQGNGQEFLETVREGRGLESIQDVLSFDAFGRCVHSRDSLGKTSLMHAIEKDEKAAGILLGLKSNSLQDNGTVTNFQAEHSRLQCRNGRTTLSYAAEQGNPAIFRKILSIREAAVNLADKSKRTPLSYACAKGHEAVVEAIVNSRHADVNFRDQNEMSPLSHAVRNGRESVVRALLKSPKLRPDVKGQHRRTPLMEAARYGQAGIAQILLASSSVDVDSLDKNRHTALWHAMDTGHQDLAELIAAHGGSNFHPGPRHHGGLGGRISQA